jgi:hypothetical protein
MKASRLGAIVAIFLGVSVAWAILGATISLRTEQAFERLNGQVAGLWGEKLSQRAPQLIVQETVSTVNAKGKPETATVDHPLSPDSSDIKVKLDSDARRKGLLWYRTYVVEFDGTYTVRHSFTRKPVLKAIFTFPSAEGIYDDFEFSVNGQEAVLGGNLQGGLTKSIALEPGKVATIHVHYKSRGRDNWIYAFDAGVSQVRNFKMSVDTDFRRLDFPPRSLSPTAKQATANGWNLSWDFASLISGFQAGVEMPQELNPGLITSRITYFAPVGLLFFLAVVVIMGLVRGQNMHPMHYFFVCGSFFSFHLLMAYLADHLPLALTFVICAVVAVAITVSYLVRATRRDFALTIAAPAQLLFLVLFSYAFFFEGYTGLSITIASIITLVILMQVTAKVDWENRFQKPSGQS